MPMDTTVNNLIINKLSKSQYAETTPSDTELYLVPDEYDVVPTSGSNNNITSGAVYTALETKATKVIVVDSNTLPPSLDPNKVYRLGTLSGVVTIPAFSSVIPDDTRVKIWCFTFETPSDIAPTITWPSGITDWVGGTAPVINTSKKYEVTVMDGIGAIVEA